MKNRQGIFLGSKKARLLVSLRQVKKKVTTSSLEHGLSSVMSSCRIIPAVEAGGEMSRKCFCSRR